MFSFVQGQSSRCGSLPFERLTQVNGREILVRLRQSRSDSLATVQQRVGCFLIWCTDVAVLLVRTAALEGNVG